MIFASLHGEMLFERMQHQIVTKKSLSKLPPERSRAWAAPTVVWGGGINPSIRQDKGEKSTIFFSPTLKSVASLLLASRRFMGYFIYNPADEQSGAILTRFSQSYLR
jgi:hypothetical protein